MKKALCTLTDTNYFKLSVVMLKSFCINNPEFDGDIIILDIGLSQTNLNDLKQFEIDFDCNIIVKSVNTTDYCALGNIISYDKICMLVGYEKETLKNRTYKFDVFKLTEYDKVLFLDSDILVTKNILELFELSKSAAVRMLYDENRARTINSGVMLLTSNMLNLDVYNNLVFHLMDIHPEWGDEEVIQRNYLDSFDILPDRYNVFNPPDTMNLLDASILHYGASMCTDIYNKLEWKKYAKIKNKHGHNIK